MEAIHRLTLIASLVRICDDLDPSKIFTHLIQGRILNFSDKEVIQKEATRRDRALNLIEMLVRKGPRAFGVFLGSLMPSHPDLYSFLQEQLRRIENDPTGIEPECKYAC